MSQGTAKVLEIFTSDTYQNSDHDSFQGLVT